jgi:hypothetical protein
MSACGGKPCRRLDVSQQRLLRVDERYFFFFLPVFFFAFFAFLAMLPSTIPKLVQCKSTSTCRNTEYTTIAKLILRASKKVNGGHTVARCEVGEAFSRCVGAIRGHTDRCCHHFSFEVRTSTLKDHLRLRLSIKKGKGVRPWSVTL